MPAAQGVVEFVNRNNGNLFEEKNARCPPAARGLSQTRQTNNKASLSQAERQRKAATARVSLPAVCSMQFKAEPETDLSGTAMVIANRSVSVASSRGRPPRNTFDDTDLDDTIGSGLSVVDNEERYVAFTTDYNHPSHEMLKVINGNHRAPQRGEYKLDGNSVFLDEVIPENWREIVATEKGLGAGLSRPSVVDDFGDVRSVYQEEGQEYDEEDIESESQGRENDIEGRQDTLDAERYRHDEQVPDRTSTQIRSHKIPPPALPLSEMKVISTFTASSIPTSKTSSYVEASENEAPPVQSATKKARIELDYDPQVLKTMTYADLDKQSFDKDPRAPDSTAPVDEHGIPLTLQRKLGNLSRMKEEDVRAMFSDQKDQDWEDTGAWFMSQFETQMRRLLEIRQERRMIALKFEMEVKRRQAAVAARMGDVEQELRYLKTGGKDLMDKRVSPTK